MLKNTPDVVHLCTLSVGKALSSIRYGLKYLLEIIEGNKEEPRLSVATGRPQIQRWHPMQTLPGVTDTVGITVCVGFS